MKERKRRGAPSDSGWIIITIITVIIIIITSVLRNTREKRRAGCDWMMGDRVWLMVQSQGSITRKVEMTGTLFSFVVILGGL